MTYTRFSDQIVVYPPLTPSSSSSLIWGLPTQGVVGLTPVDIATANSGRKGLVLNSNGKIWLNIGIDVSPDFKLFELNAGDTLFLDFAVTQRVSAIAEVADTGYTMMEAA